MESASVAIRNALIGFAAVLALTAQTPAPTPGSEGQAFGTMIGAGLAAAPGNFASIRGQTNHGNRYVGLYDPTAAVDATYLKACSVVDETDGSSFEHPSWQFQCTLSLPGDASDARLAEIAAEVVPAVPAGFTRAERGFKGGRLVYWAGPGNTYVVIQKGPGAAFALSVRHGPGSVDL
jgi:hypothetical protein